MGDCNFTKNEHFQGIFQEFGTQGKNILFSFWVFFQPRMIHWESGKGGDKAVFIFDHQFHFFMSFRYYLASDLIAAHAIKTLLLDKIYPPLEASAD